MGQSHRWWLDRRDNESRDEWLVRQDRSCYFCPHEPFSNAVEASDHEDVCEHNPHVRRARQENDQQ